MHSCVVLENTECMQMHSNFSFAVLLRFWLFDLFVLVSVCVYKPNLARGQSVIVHVCGRGAEEARQFLV